MKDVRLYNSVISAYARIGDVKNAQSMLEELIYSYSEMQDPNLKPNKESISTTIKAYTKHCSNNNAGDCVEELLTVFK